MQEFRVSFTHWNCIFRRWTVNKLKKLKLNPEVQTLQTVDFSITLNSYQPYTLNTKFTQKPKPCILMTHEDPKFSAFNPQLKNQNIIPLGRFKGKILLAHTALSPKEDWHI